MAGPVSLPRDKPASYVLVWTAPTSCPDAASIEAAIAALAPAPAGGVGVMAVDGRVDATADGFSLQLQTDYGGRRSVRQVQAKRCQDLADSTALVVAIALEPDVSPSAPTPVTDEEPGRRAAAVPTAPSVTAPRDTTSPPVWQPHAAAPRSARSSRRRAAIERPTAWGLRLAPMLEVGGLPKVGGGLSLAVGLLWPRVRVDVIGMHLWPRRTDEVATAAALVQLGVAAVQACARPFAGPVEFPLCGGIEGGAVRASSRRLPNSRTVHGPWIAPRASVGIAASGSRVGFWGALSLAVPVVTTRVLLGKDPAFSGLPVSFRVVSGVEIFFQ